MIHFLSPLNVNLDDSDRKIKATLLAEFVCMVDCIKIAVPSGFETNLASIPRVVWSIPGFAPFGRIEKPSVLHDYLYSKDCPIDISRQKADEILVDGMKTEGENWLVRRTVYIVVRGFGASHWRVSP